MQAGLFVSERYTSSRHKARSCGLVCCEEHHEVVALAAAHIAAPRVLLVQGLKGPQDCQVVGNAGRRGRRAGAILGAVGLHAITTFGCLPGCS